MRVRSLRMPRGSHPSANTPAIPDLVHGQFEAARPRHAVVGDITYIRTWEGWSYPATVVDVFSRRVIGFSLAGHYASLSRRPTGVVAQRLRSGVRSAGASPSRTERCTRDTAVGCLLASGREALLSSHVCVLIRPPHRSLVLACLLACLGVPSWSGGPSVMAATTVPLVNPRRSEGRGDAAGTEAPVATPACDAMKAVGQWNTAWIRSINSTRPGPMSSWPSGMYRSGVVLAKEVESLSIAFDTSTPTCTRPARAATSRTP